MRFLMLTVRSVSRSMDCCSARWITDHVLHACTMTDSDLAVTPSSNDWSALGAMTLVKEQGLVPQEWDLYQEYTDSEMDTLHRDPHCDTTALQRCRMTWLCELLVRHCSLVSHPLLRGSRPRILIVSRQFAPGHRAVHAQPWASRNRTNTSSLGLVIEQTNNHSQELNSVVTEVTAAESVWQAGIAEANGRAFKMDSKKMLDSTQPGDKRRIWGMFWRSGVGQKRFVANPWFQSISAWQRMCLLLRADQRLKQNHEDVLLLAHLQELYLSGKDQGLMLSGGTYSHIAYPVSKTTEYSSSSWWSISWRRWSDSILESERLSSVRTWEFSTLVWWNVEE